MINFQMEISSVSVEFGKWLYDKRKAARLSQEELADRAGCSKNYISTLERNAPHTATGALPMPSRRVVMALAGALDAPAEEALDVAGYAAPPKPTRDHSKLEPEYSDEEEMLAFYRGAPSEIKQAARVLLRAAVRDAESEETTHGRKAE